MIALANGQPIHSAEVFIRDESVSIRLTDDSCNGNYLKHLYDNHISEEIDVFITGEFQGVIGVHRAKVIITAITSTNTLPYGAEGLTVLDCECTPRYDTLGNIDGVNYSVEWMEKL